MVEDWIEEQTESAEAEKIQLTSKTAQRLKELKEFGNIYEADVQANTIIIFKNELKEIIENAKTYDECVIATDKINNLIQEIESVEK